MKTAYFDCYAGISGDMTVGALVDLGVDFGALQTELRKLGLREIEIRSSKVARTGITATKFDVAVNDHKERRAISRSASGEKSAAKGRSRHADHPGKERRTLSDIVAVIRRSALSDSVKALSVKIFERLGGVEAKIHNIPIERVHFHEVGAADSIADIVGAAICLDWLNFEKVMCSPINVGAGFVECQHGKLPVPAPATAELLKGLPMFSAGPRVELTTPTGAAIISAVATQFGRLPAFRSERIGYGAGDREFPDFPNALRVFVGTDEDRAGASLDSTGGCVEVIETNIDDMNPQIYGYFMEKAMTAGALDVYLTPVQMKKNRPGHGLTIICEPRKLEEVVKLVFAETTTLGLRIHQSRRRTLNRRIDFIETSYGRIRVKTAQHDGAVVNRMPEYEDCLRAAEEHAVPLKNVLAEVVAKIHGRQS